MFDQFTQRARRVIFFARFEASKTGCHAISTEHLLLGLMRENMYLLPEFPPDSDLAAIRSELFGQPPAESLPTSVDIPLTESAKRVLQKSTQRTVFAETRPRDVRSLVAGNSCRRGK
jgi:ATP-dependent Clp protease ATP-binding subunit ClpC